MFLKVFIQIIDKTHCLGEYSLIFIFICHEIFADLLVLEEFFLDEALLFADDLGYLFLILRVKFNQLNKWFP